MLKINGVTSFYIAQTVLDMIVGRDLFVKRNAVIKEYTTQVGGITVIPLATGAKALTVRDAGDSADRVVLTEAGDGRFTGNLVVGSRVGIGTTTPAANLDIYQSAEAAYLRVRGAGDGENFAAVELHSVEATSKTWQFAHKQVAANLNKLIVYYHDGTSWLPRVTIDTLGNVGIGTTAPAEKLDVAGNIKASGYGDLSSLRVGGAEVIDSLRNILNVGNIASSGVLTLGANPAASGQIRLPNNAWITARNAANTGDVNMIQVNSSDQVVFGTSLGAFTLGGPVTGNGQNITGLGLLTVDNIRLDGNTIDSTSGGLTISVPTDQSLTLSAPGAGHIVLSPGTGNVGIGTITPAEKLDVVGNIKASGYGNLGSLRIGGTEAQIRCKCWKYKHYSICNH